MLQFLVGGAIGAAVGYGLKEYCDTYGCPWDEKEKGSADGYWDADDDGELDPQKQELRKAWAETREGIDKMIEESRKEWDKTFKAFRRMGVG